MAQPTLRDIFIQTLHENGFSNAAINWRDNYIDFERAIAAWDYYPECLDEYPTQLTKKP